MAYVSYPNEAPVSQMDVRAVHVFPQRWLVTLLDEGSCPVR